MSGGAGEAARGRVAGEWLLAVLLGALILVGCGDLTSGGGGEVEVVLTSSGITPEDETVELPPPVEGTLEARLQVWVANPRGTWIEVTGGSKEIALSLGTDDSVSVAIGSISPGLYGGVRTRFTHLEVQVTGGLVVEGDTIRERVRVDMEALDQEIVIDRALAFEVLSLGVFSLVLDLNADAWLRRLDVLSCRDADCQVTPVDFANEFQVRRGR